MRDRCSCGVAGLVALALAACSPAGSPPPETAAETAAAAAPSHVGVIDPGAMSEISFEDTLGALDPDAHRLIWVLPPGVEGVGPFTANVQVRARGEERYAETIPLGSEINPADLVAPALPGSQIIRLSADGAWPGRLAGIRAAMAAVTAEFGPGNGELEVSSGFITRMTDDGRARWCADGAERPPVQLLLQDVGAGTLDMLQIGDMARSIIADAILSGCDAPPSP
jgi:hypothetical protein